MLEPDVKKTLETKIEEMRYISSVFNLYTQYIKIHFYFVN
jgi:hypothetical protein